ncbi:folylpolyglutamate synthase, mitochondrial, partial [Caerostris darwini]
KPVVVGITTLGIDHVNILGKTIAEIAEQKAGIMKPNVPIFTVTQQESAMKVLRKKAEIVKCPLFLSPPLEAYEETISLKIQGTIQNVNASLALQLTNTWLKQMKYLEPLQFNACDFSNDLNETQYVPIPMASIFHIGSNTKGALESCVWPGRFQTVEKEKLTFYLDGAHTQQSIKHCVRWFEHASTHKTNLNKQSILRVLLFNCTGERKAESLLDPLADIHFDLVMFCPNRINVMKDASSDLSNFMVDPEKEIQQCITNKEIWCHLMRSLYENELSVSASNSSIKSESRPSITINDNSLLFPSISEALNFISSPETLNNGKMSASNTNGAFSDFVKNADHIQVLITGSLHLVGGVLSLIDT